MHHPGLGEDITKRKGAPWTKRGAIHSPNKTQSDSQGSGREVGQPSGCYRNRRFHVRRHLTVRSHDVLGVRVMGHLFLLHTALYHFLLPVNHLSHCLSVWIPDHERLCCILPPPSCPYTSWLLLYVTFFIINLVHLFLCFCFSGSSEYLLSTARSQDW